MEYHSISILDFEVEFAMDETEQPVVTVRE
jgi:hypothetical protein